MRKVIYSLCCIILFNPLTAYAITEQQDLDFIYQTIIANHPGIYNTADPDFKANTVRFYDITKQKLAKTSELVSQESVISQFAQSFADPHLGVQWNHKSSSNAVPPRYNHPFKAETLNNNIVWVTLPTFELNKEQESGFEIITQELAKYRSNKVIVFDIRGNDGGNSYYGDLLLYSLFGQNYVNNKNYLNARRNNTYADWRASPTNLSRITCSISKKNNDNDDREWLLTVKHGMESSIRDNNPYYRDYEYSADLTTTAPKSQFNGKIILIINQDNYSAALSFIDEVKLLAPQSILVGQTTGADRLYTDINSIPLPSGLGDFIYPMKVYRNQVRADNEHYHPDMPFANISDTMALQQLVIKLITN